MTGRRWSNQSMLCMFYLTLYLIRWSPKVVVQLELDRLDNDKHIAALYFSMVTSFRQPGDFLLILD
jgi:hypothetical protein